jgi:NADH:ubiquinone oxidoreductase subunit 3 (subunit A)
LQIWPLVVYFVAVIALVLTMLGLSWLLGERRANAATNEAFESGVVSVGNAQGRISVNFYLIAIFFVIFDLETVFIYVLVILLRMEATGIAVGNCVALQWKCFLDSRYSFSKAFPINAIALRESSNVIWFGGPEIVLLTSTM